MSSKISEGVSTMITEQLEAFNTQCSTVAENAIECFISDANKEYNLIIEQLAPKLDDYSKFIDELQESIGSENNHDTNEKVLNLRKISSTLHFIFKNTTDSILSKIDELNGIKSTQIKDEVKAYLNESIK